MYHGDGMGGTSSILALVKPAPVKPRSRRPMVVGYVALILAIFGTGALVAYRARREAQAEELQILQGVRRVCKLATVEVSLADYAKKTVPKAVDLPFTKEPRGVPVLRWHRVGRVRHLRRARGHRRQSCGAPGSDHAAAAAHPVIDIQRFETINESRGS